MNAGIYSFVFWGITIITNSLTSKFLINWILLRLKALFSQPLKTLQNFLLP